jgi:carbon-monoxide dehydrogenase large subunit
MSGHQGKHAHSGIGARMLRWEDERHLFGRGRFVDDLVFAHLLALAFVPSPLA